MISGACKTRHGGYTIWIWAPIGPNTWECRAAAIHNTGADIYGPFVASVFARTLLDAFCNAQRAARNLGRKRVTVAPRLQGRDGYVALGASPT